MLSSLCRRLALPGATSCRLVSGRALSVLTLVDMFKSGNNWLPWHCQAEGIVPCGHFLREQLNDFKNNPHQPSSVNEFSITTSQPCGRNRHSQGPEGADILENSNRCRRVYNDRTSIRALTEFAASTGSQSTTQRVRVHLFWLLLSHPQHSVITKNRQPTPGPCRKLASRDQVYLSVS